MLIFFVNISLRMIVYRGVLQIINIVLAGNCYLILGYPVQSWWIPEQHSQELTPLWQHVQWRCQAPITATTRTRLHNSQHSCSLSRESSHLSNGLSVCFYFCSYFNRFKKDLSSSHHRHLVRLQIFVCIIYHVIYKNPISKCYQKD